MLVDLQVNGYKGLSFTPKEGTSVSIDELRLLCRAYFRDAAVVAFVPTMVTSSMATYQQVLPILADLVEDHEFRGRLPGIHLEGPFISPLPGAIGAHNVASVTTPSVEAFNELQTLARGHVRILTIAAEVEGLLSTE